MYNSPKLIAEIGCNHKGDINIAKQLVKIAAESNVKVVKFQKRNNKELLTDEPRSDISISLKILGISILNF